MLLYIEQRAHEILLWRPITFLSYHKTVFLELGPFWPSFQYDILYHDMTTRQKGLKNLVSKVIRATVIRLSDFCYPSIHIYYIARLVGVH